MPVKCKRCQSKKVSLVKELSDSFLYKCKNCGKECEIKKDGNNG